MKNTFGSLETEMTSQLADRDKERETLLARLDEVNEECQCLRRALKALKIQPGPSKRKKAPNQSDVSAALSELLTDNPIGIDRRDLEALLAEKLAVKHDRSAVGLALRIQEVLTSGRFLAEEGVIRTARHETVST